MDKKLNILVDFFYRLDKNNIHYLVLRNYAKLPESTSGSDLDIVINEKDKASFFKLLQSMIRQREIDLVSYVPDKRCPKYCLLSKKQGIQMDCFFGGVFFGAKEIIPVDTLFKRVFYYNGLSILDKNAGVLLAILKELLNNGTCGEKYIKELQEAYEKSCVDEDLLINFNSSFQSYFQSSILNLDRENWEKLYLLSRQSFSRKRYSNIPDKIKRLMRKPGYTVAFLGTDGSGKSTIINAITPVLEEAFHNGVYYEHMRPNRFSSLAKAMGKKDSFEGPVTNPHGSSSSGFVGSLFRWGYYMLDYTLGYWIKIWPKKATKSCVWIFDRYYYDYLIDPKRARIKLPRFILKMGQRLIPEPDMIFCLGTEPEKIHNRKPELALEEVRRQTKALKRFCDLNPRAKWIDTGESISGSTEAVMEELIYKMGQRFKSIL